MISVMNDKDLEFDQNFDLVADEPLERPEISDDDSSDIHVHREAVGVSEELENRASESDIVSRVSIGNGKITESTESDEIRVLVVDGEEIYEDMKPGDSDFRNEDLGQVVNGCKRGDKSRGSSLRCSRVENDEFDSERNGIVELSSKASVHKLHVPTFDDFMTNGRAKGTGFGGSTSVGYGYEIGDMIWGKVKSHPWWPGVIYNDSFASHSVRRTKREGHVFVAFFGDGSYGWFEPAELIPFDANFSEKSRQTNSRTFVKAVEDAVDEVSRRSGLGLACRCRNPYNFRQTDALGYFSVDLNNYEVGGVYSIGQIRKARASFQPRDTVAFMKQLALMARDEVYTSMYFFKNKATVLAYRKSVFEEFDETYAQAFGQQPVRPSRKSLEAVAHPVRVPLSGPMVVAEALGNWKRKSTKSHKSKEQENKEKYLFKRRDELSELKIHQTGQGTFSKQQPGFVEGFAALSVGDYALQKGADGNIAEPPFAFAESSQCQAPNSSFENRKGPRLESNGGEANMNLRHDQQRVTTSVLAEGLHQPPNLPATDEEGKHVSPKIDPEVRGQDPRVHVDTGKKTAKLLKRPVVELGVEKSSPGKKKMKKREKESGIEMPSDHSQKQAAPGKGGPSSLLLPDSIGKQSTFGMGDIKHKLPQLLDDLQALALNPFHGVDSNTPSTVQMAFMKFRSVVFEKSFSSAETESNEANAPKLQDGSSIGFELPPRENTKDLSSPKQPKRLIRPDDPTKGGRKRAPSDRQEAMALKRLKKVEDLKSLAVEKKAPQKTLETHRDGKEAIDIRPPKLLKPFSIKKTTDSSSKACVPTMLIMKFPPNTNLPSRSELKARLARFGPLDHSTTRVFWHSFTCRVVFLHKSDAEAAHRHLIGSNSLFGNVNVRSSIRALGATGPESESKVQREDVVEQKPLKPQQLVQLKSCLKKVAGEEVVMGAATTGGNVGCRGTPHVKFVLEEGESSGGRGSEHLIGGNRNYNNNNTSSFAGGGKSSSHGMEFNSRNFQKGILPLPSATAKLRNTSNDMGYGEVAPRNIHNFDANIGRIGPSPINIDIAQQMLGLLTKCNDLVANVSSFLGYVPYHPL